MAAQIFLKFSGDDTQGESKAEGHEGEIEVFSYSFGASNPANLAGGGGSAGVVDLSSISLQKQLDAASMFLFKNCCLGKHYDEAWMVVRESTGDVNPQNYFEVHMKMVYIDSISWGAAAGGGKPSESLSVEFGAIELTYYEQKPDGTLDKKGPVQRSVKKNNESLDVS